MSKFCGICDCNIEGATWECHKTSRDHLKKLQQKENSIILEREESWNQITRNDIIFVFSKFGPIVKISLHNKTLPNIVYACVEFTRPDIVQKVLEMRYYKIHGLLVKVKKYVSEKQEELAAETEQREDEAHQEKENMYLEEMYKSIKRGATTDEQIQQMATKLRTPEELHSKALELRCELEKVIRAYIPEVKVYLIGSLCNGLGVRSSDVNLEVEFNAKSATPPSDMLPPPPANVPGVLLKSLKLLLKNGRIPALSVIKNNGVSDILWLILEIIHKSKLSEDFTCLTFDKSVNRPIARILFKDKKRNVHGDIRIKKGCSMNRHLARTVKMLTNLDERVQPLYIVVRHWSRQIRLQETFPSYSIFSLLYLYLQNTKPPILPSIDTLSAMCPERYQMTIDSIVVSICLDVNQIKQQCLMSQNTQTLSQLLQGFFRYYAKLEMSNRVFCPRSGRSYNMLKFRNMKKVISDLDKFNLLESCFHIQDIYRVAQNIVGPTHYINKHRISLEFLRAATITRDKVDVDWNLLSVIPTKVVKNQLDSILQKAPIVIPFDAVLLPEGFLSYSSYSEAERHWYQWVVELTMKVLHVLRIDYELEGDYGVQIVEGKRQLHDELDSNKRFKTEGDSLIHASDRNAAMNFEMCFEPDRQVIQETRLKCKDTMQLWKMRRKNSYSRKVTKDLFAAEESVTLQQLKKDIASKVTHEFILVMQHVKTANESQIEMGVESIGSDFGILTFMNFFQDFVMRLVCSEVGLDVTYLAAKFQRS